MTHVFKSRTVSFMISAIPLALGTMLLSASPSFAKIDTGANVSDMVVKTASGDVHNLSDFAGKRVVLEWTNHGCPYVQKHYTTNNMQNLQKLATADDDTVWLSIISSAEGQQGHLTGPEAVLKNIKRGAEPSAVILDPKGNMGRAFEAKTTPHMYIIDAEQTLVYQGAIDDNRSANPKTVAGAKNYVTAALSDLDAGRAVQEPTTSPYGCSVKYKG
ncbi:MAG: redoxin family protein [Litorimonas sp.]